MAKIERTLTTEQCGKALDKSGDWIRRRAAAGEIPFMNTSRGRRFNPNEVKSALAARSGGAFTQGGTDQLPPPIRRRIQATQQAIADARKIEYGAAFFPADGGSYLQHLHGGRTR